MKTAVPAEGFSSHTHRLNCRIGVVATPADAAGKVAVCDVPPEALAAKVREA